MHEVKIYSIKTIRLSTDGFFVNYSCEIPCKNLTYVILKHIGKNTNKTV